MSILVTGGTGLVGSHLLLKLCLTSENEIKAIYRSQDKVDKVKQLFYFEEKENLFKKIDWIKADINNQESLEEVFKGIRFVYHSAAKVSFNKRDYNELIRTNSDATATIVNLCLDNGVEKMCYVSSVAALGNYLENKCVDEKAAWQKTDSTSAYSISKFSGENEVWRASEEGLNVVIVNPTTIIGYGDWEESSLKIVKRVADGLSFYPSGSNGFVGVKDVVNIMVELMNSTIKNERFVLVSENMKFKSLFDLIANELGKNKPKRKLAKKWAKYFLWVEQFRSYFGGNPVLTKSSLHTAYNHKCYSSEKIITTLNYSFEKMESVIKNALKDY